MKTNGDKFLWYTLMFLTFCGTIFVFAYGYKLVYDSYSPWSTLWYIKYSIWVLFNLVWLASLVVALKSNFNVLRRLIKAFDKEKEVL
jgi:hypothetical protein